MKDEQRLDGNIRDVSPCKGCQERHTACSDKCERYKAWKSEIERVKQARKAYMDSRQDDGKRRDRWVIKR